MADLYMHTPHDLSEGAFPLIYFRRLDTLIQRQIYRLSEADLPSSESENVFTSLHFSEQQVIDLLHHPFGLDITGQEIPSTHECVESEFIEALDQIEHLLSTETIQAEEQEILFPFCYLAIAFNLDCYAVDVIFTCLAPALVLRYQKLYGYLLDDMTRTRPTPNMILDLLVEPGPERLEYLHYFADESPLFKHRLIQRSAEPGLHDPSLLNQPLAIDPTLVHWVLGVYEPAAAIRDFVTFENEPIGEAALFTAAQQTALEQAVDNEALLLFYGRDEVAQQSAARVLAQRQERALLILDLARAVKAGLSAQEAVEWTLRDGLLVAAAVCINGWDACLEEDATPVALFQTICAHPGPVVICSQDVWQARQVERSRRLSWVEFPVPDYLQRANLFRHFLAETAFGEDDDLALVAGEFKLTTGQIRDVVSSAIDQAVQADRPLTGADLFAAARRHSNSRLATLATKLAPRYSWNDIVLPADQMARLEELINKVRYRAFVMDTWGVGEKLSSGGISALFCGRPGTGKTMSAQIIAHELGLDVYRIDLSSMVSKYIGETEKNLERIFTEAESSNAILFFDEADAIFGKRSETKDAHDRYANIEVSYLLQRMENFDGMTILATNLRANLDEAFTRRFDTIIDFPFPEEAERLQIWQTLLPATIPQESELDLRRLARTFKIAGGNIRNIIVDTIYLAAADGKVITMRHLLHSTRRELQKMGWLINERDFREESP